MRVVTLCTVVPLLVLALALSAFGRVTPHQPDGMSPIQIANASGGARNIQSAGVFFLNTFDVSPVISATQAAGAWYTDRYAPAAFESQVFDGGNRLHVAISSADALLSRPGGYQYTFYNTHGRDFDLGNGFGSSITGDLYVGADWGTKHRRADLWASMGDNTNSVSSYPIIGFGNTTGSNATFRVYDSQSGAWINLATPIVYGAWYTLKIEFTPTAFNYYINGNLVYTDVQLAGSTHFMNMMVQAYNFGDPSLGTAYALESYDVYWDNIGAVSGIHNTTANTYSATIQEAINAATTGDVIAISSGTYTENINLSKNVTLVGDAVSRPVIVGLVQNAGHEAIANTLVKNLVLRNSNAILDFPAGTTIDGLKFENVDFDFNGTSTPVSPSGYTSMVTFVSASVSGSGLTFKNCKLCISTSPIPSLNGLNSFAWLQGSGGPVMLDGVDLSGKYTDGGVTFGAQYNLGMASNNVSLVNSSTHDGGNYYLSSATGLTVQNNTFSNAGFALNNISNAVIQNNVFQNIDQTIKCGGPGPTNRVIQMEAAWGDASFALKNILIQNNTFTNINGVNAMWVTRFTSGDPAPATFANVRAHGNVFSALTNGAKGAVSDYPTALFDATNNYWGSETGPSGVGSGTGFPVGTNVTYDPWTGKAVTNPVSNSTPIPFSNTNVTMTFTGAAAGTVSVQQTPEPPTGVPAPPVTDGVLAPLYLQITSSLTNGSFNATVVLDVSGIPGFTASTLVMYYSTASSRWITISNGVYNATAHTFTFQTDHFTPFAFINPTTPLDLYLTQNTAAPTTHVWYPNNGTGDWSYSGMTTTVYVVPTGAQQFFGANFTLLWDATKATAVISKGNLFDPAQTAFFTSGTAGQIQVQTANLDNTINVTPDGQSYIAKIVFTVTKPGLNAISVNNLDFRYYDATSDAQASVFVVQHPDSLRLYLGDFDNEGGSGLTGDGKVDFHDLVPFSTSYWSVSPAASYKTKFDVGPTSGNGSYFAMPIPDGKVEFEDLVIFAIGYGKSGAGMLPKQVAVKPVTLALDKAEQQGDLVRVPITLNGTVTDLRAISLVLTTQGLEFTRVEKAGELNNDYTFMASKSEGGKLMIDAAIIGAEHEGISKAGTIAYVVFSGKGSVSIEKAIARTSGNSSIEVKYTKAGKPGEELPAQYTLDQNYPNPFNPTTTIHYAVAKDGPVTITVYNMLGEAVANLVSGMQQAGFYEVSWNGTNNNHQTVASGVYLYKINAGDFVSVKKMALMK